MTRPIRTGWRRSGRVRLIRAKVVALVAAGATVVGEQTYGGEFGHVVMTDPGGNEFCVA